MFSGAAPGIWKGGNWESGFKRGFHFKRDEARGGRTDKDFCPHPATVWGVGRRRGRKKTAVRITAAAAARIQNSTSNPQLMWTIPINGRVTASTVKATTYRTAKIRARALFSKVLLYKKAWQIRHRREYPYKNTCLLPQLGQCAPRVKSVG